jgi:alkaline phosphatase D
MNVRLFILLCICSLTITAQKIPVLNPELKPFYHGVASGDPLKDKIILWTRITPDILPSSPLQVYWEVSKDLSFSTIEKSGNVLTDSLKDWTIKIDADGLQAGQTYYYRFKAPNGNYSIIGRTKTAPDNTISNLRFAVVSCSSIFSGYFNAYKRISERADLDAVIHLGDYIYDFVDNDELNRVRPEDTLPLITLNDFRDRLAYYHLDKDMRSVHQQHPFIIMWDNHELRWSRSDSISLDKYKGAIQAFYEWTPIREPSDRKKMYRYFSYGGLADIVLSDVTHFREKPFSPPGSNAADDPNRKLWGDEQYNWLTNKLYNSTAKWKIVGSQKQFGQWNLLGVPTGTTQGTAFASLLSEGDVNEYNADRVRFLKFLRDNKINNTIVVSGDLHFSFAMDLCENPFNPLYYNSNTGDKSVGVEFQPTSITRVNFDEKTKGLIPPDLITSITQNMLQINRHQRYADLVQHGYGILDLRSEKATGEFWYCNKLAEDSIQKMDAAFEIFDTINHWNRTKLTIPTIPLLQAAPLAPYELLTGVVSTKTLDAKVDLFPNPAKDFTTLKIVTEKNKNITINLVDIATGIKIKEIFSGEIFSTKFLQINISDIASQTVLVVITSGDEVLSKKLVIAK